MWFRGAWGCKDPASVEGWELMKRVTCGVTADCLVKPIRANLATLCLSKATDPDLDAVAEHFEQTIIDVLSVTVRPCKSILKEAAQKALSADANEAKLWACRISDCISYCVHKARSATSGKKLPKSVYRLSLIHI